MKMHRNSDIHRKYVFLDLDLLVVTLVTSYRRLPRSSRPKSLQLRATTLLDSCKTLPSLSTFLSVDSSTAVSIDSSSNRFSSALRTLMRLAKGTKGFLKDVKAPVKDFLIDILRSDCKDYWISVGKFQTDVVLALSKLF